MAGALRLLLVLTLLGAAGCREGIGRLLDETGHPPIREISASEAADLLARDAAVTIVHPLPRHPATPRLKNAVWLAPEDPVPEGWGARHHPVLVVGEPDAAAALAARLARAGTRPLSVVTGELDTLADLRTARHP